MKDLNGKNKEGKQRTEKGTWKSFVLQRKVGMCKVRSKGPAGDWC
jgi:hypothetical protein